MSKEKDIYTLIKLILAEPTKREEHIRRLQDSVFGESRTDPEDPVWKIFGDLAYDLDFFEPDPALRREDPVFFDHDELEERVRDALIKLERPESNDGGADGGE